MHLHFSGSFPHANVVLASSPLLEMDFHIYCVLMEAKTKYEFHALAIEKLQKASVLDSQPAFGLFRALASTAGVARHVQSADTGANVTRWKRLCDRALPLQALLLREQGGAGQLGDGHHQDEGKSGISALVRAPAGDVLMSRTRGERGRKVPSLCKAITT